jgi:hypothetical protein
VKVALLTAGPSLRDCVDLHPLDQYDLIVTVNSAGKMYPMDWHCALDAFSVAPWFPAKPKLPLPRVGFATKWDHARRLKCHRRRIHPIPHPIKGRMCWNTLPNALAFAQRLGVVTVLGFDCTCVPDCMGEVPGHTEDRWARELEWVRLALRADTVLVGNASRDVLARVGR